MVDAVVGATLDVWLPPVEEEGVTSSEVLMSIGQRPGQFPILRLYSRISFFYGSPKFFPFPIASESLTNLDQLRLDIFRVETCNLGP